MRKFYFSRANWDSTFREELMFLNPKSEALNPKWFDKLTTLSQVEGQIRMIQTPMTKTGGTC
jgi:hypothetical protein